MGNRDFFSEGYAAFRQGWADVEPEDVAEAGDEAIGSWFDGWYRAEEDVEGDWEEEAGE